MKEKIIKTETIYKGTFIDVEKSTVELANQNTATRDIIRHPGASAVVAIDDSKNVILVSQYRTPIAKIFLEIPAGKLDDQKEDPLVCAKRELQEETGYTAKEYIHLTSFTPTPAICDEIIHIYLATQLSSGKSNPDEDEFLEMTKMPLKEAIQKIHNKEITDAKTIIGLLMTDSYFEEK